MRVSLIRRLGVPCALALLLSGAAARAQPADGGPVGVIVAPAQAARFVDRVEALGTTRANESVEITANVTEKIAEIRFADGQQVAAGDVLVILEDAEERAALAAAEATLAQRRADFERARQLERRKFTARAQLDARRAAFEQAQADLQVARARLSDRRITAPFAGVVGLRDVSRGALVEPGDRITTLDDLGVVKLDVPVPASYLASLRPGLEIEATTSAFAGRVFEGEVASVATQVDPVTRSIVARAILPNPDASLRPGLLMRVALLKNPRQAVVVPEAALVPLADKTFVLVVDQAAGNVVSRREVRIGARRPGEVEVLSGLRPGALVVTHGTLKVADGQRVEIIARESADRPLSEMLRSGVEG